ncbi:hypothetical protein IKE71_03405 [Candidatus Saccharibacteria bacterium]|nr:hypothetical protein [Candidatus Saccharibacteria bacterium]
MEEKLYFKPASYGKGNKKKDEPEKTIKSKKNDYRARSLVIFLILVVIIVLVVLWFLRGKTTITGQYPANVRNEYLDCAANNIVYAKVGSVDSKQKELRATMVFLGKEELSSISIKYTLEFADKAAASYAEPIVSTRFHENIAKVIDQYGAFNNKVTLLDDTIVVTLHASKTDLENELAKEFFLIPKAESPTTLSDYREAFESQGLTCTSSLDNN